MLELWRQKRANDRKKVLDGIGKVDILPSLVHGAPNNAAVGPSHDYKRNPVIDDVVRRALAHQEKVVENAAIERKKREEEYIIVQKELAAIEVRRKARMKEESNIKAVDQLAKNVLAEREQSEGDISVVPAKGKDMQCLGDVALSNKKDIEDQQRRVARDLVHIERQSELLKKEQDDNEAEAKRRLQELNEANERDQRAVEDAAVLLMLAEDPVQRATLLQSVRESIGIDDNVNNNDDGIEEVLRNLTCITCTVSDCVDAETPVIEGSPNNAQKYDNSKSIEDEQNQQPLIKNGGIFIDALGTCVNVEELTAMSPSPYISRDITCNKVHNNTPKASSNPLQDQDNDRDSDYSDISFRCECLCRDVSYAPWLSYVYGSFTCTCSVCRRFTGSTYGAEWLHLPKVQFPDIAQKYQYISINNNNCYFCRRCGTSVAMEHQGVEGCVLSKATLDDASVELLEKYQQV
eukprot:Tbor_TRINITY_DN8414_c0_g1::TRINITY_DN8414_c0_g1_i1::g.5335::m.5335